jgi:hypothetical protein
MNHGCAAFPDSLAHIWGMNDYHAVTPSLFFLRLSVSLKQTSAARLLRCAAAAASTFFKSGIGTLISTCFDSIFFTVLPSVYLCDIQLYHHDKTKAN